MQLPREPELAELVIADPPDRWRELGFEVDGVGHLDIGGVRIRLGGEGAGITAWSLMRVNAMGSIDGLPSPVPRVLYPPPFKTHPNGATGIDHVVIHSSSLERTSAAFARAGVELGRARDGAHGRTAARRLGPAVMEVVERPELEAEDTRFWGLAIVVISLDELAVRLGERLAPARPAPAPGRQIADLRADGSLSVPLSFMTPEPP